MQTEVLRLAENKNNEQNEKNVEFPENNINNPNYETIPMGGMGANTIPTDGIVTSRLMNTKIVRIYPGTVCAFTTGCKKLMFNVTTISKRDDNDRRNENELPLFDVIEKLPCHCLWINCAKEIITFEYFDPNNPNVVFAKSNIINRVTKVDNCCDDTYYILPNILTDRVSNGVYNSSTIMRHDTRSHYRTYEIMGQSYYKIGNPYVPKEISCIRGLCNCITCIPCCCCFKLCICNDEPCRCCCCCCCCTEIPEIYDDKRTYIDIYNMDDQPVGKFARYMEPSGCCKSGALFYEVYFPPDANEILRLSLITQIIFFIKLRISFFGILPGSRINLEQFIN